MKNYITKLENGEKALNAAFDELDNQLKEYAKNTAVIAADPTVNHLTFYTYIKEALDPIFAMSYISYDILMQSREAYLKTEKEIGIFNQSVTYYQMYVNYASLKFEAFDKICHRYEPIYREAEEYLKKSCKCGQTLQLEKLPIKIAENIKNKKGESKWTKII